MSNKVKNIQVVDPIILNQKAMKPNTPDHQLTTQQLEELLKKRKADEKLKLERERKAYEKNRDKVVSNIITTAKNIHKELVEFKQYCHIEMEQQGEKLAEYGKIRSNSKGGFSVTNTEDDFRVTRRRDTEPVWDERSVKAVELIKSFLGDTIKKKDTDTYEVLMTFLERNKNGDLEYSRVMDLLQHENRWEDERWKEGLRLIKQSFSNHLKGFGYEFKTKGEDGKWNTLLLNFSSL
jgi:hypothetical protein